MHAHRHGAGPVSAAIRDRIIDAAATTFAARGYHHAVIDEISFDAGVSNDALCDEFPDRYDLFSAAVLRAAESTLRATDHLASAPTDARQARTQIIANIEATAKATIARRNGSGFYRSHARYLSPEHRARHRDLVEEVQERLRRPLAIMRPELSPQDVRLLAAAAHSTIASITIHPTTLPESKIFTLLTTAALRVLDSRLGTLDDLDIDHPPVRLPWHDDRGSQNRAIESAMQLYAARGYEAVTIDDVAEASGVPAEEIAREVGSKYDLMHAGCVIGYSYLKVTNDAMLALPGGPRAVLAGLCGSYVHHSFSDPESITAFLSDARNIPGAGRADLLDLQNEFLSIWIRTLSEARPELSQPEASFLAFAALGIVSDLGRSIAWRDGAEIRARIGRIVLVVMATACP
jgi:AcrR family transcriptional regulator